MKKLVLALSFVFVLGLVDAIAQDAKPAQAVKKAPVKTEKVVAAKPAAAAKSAVKAKQAVAVKPVNKGAKRTDDAPAESKVPRK